jgi:AraC-like DNA-binding protein
MTHWHAPTPTVPVSYVWLVLKIAEDHGVAPQRLLNGLRISPAQLDNPDGRIGLLDDYAEICRRAMACTGEPGLGYEFGLRATLTTHGILGWGLMSQPNLRQVLDFAARFGAILRMPAWDMHFGVDAQWASMDAMESISHGDLRRFSAEQLLVCVASMLRQLLPDAHHGGIELFFDHPEPPYHARFAHRLPRCHFDSGRVGLRVPASCADVRLQSSDVIAAKLAERECAKELSLLHHAHDPVTRVRALLVSEPDGYPSLEQVASLLHVSPRTLTRQLAERGLPFRQLLQEAQQRDSARLLEDTRLPLAEIADQLGYSSVANFVRAFRGWHGTTPQVWREQHGAQAGKPQALRQPGIGLTA